MEGKGVELWLWGAGGWGGGCAGGWGELRKG